MTSILKFKKTILTGLASAILLTTPLASAEPGAWSEKPVRIVVTFPPGGTSDLVARLLAKYLDSEFGQKAVVDNRPGAAGTVAADYVASQPADGTTLILANNAPFTIAPTRFKSIPYKPVEDFSHIAYLGASSPGLMIQPSLNIKDIAGLIEYSKTNEIAYGSSGVGSISHILGVATQQKLGIKTIHVPYKGSSPAIQDFRAGVLDSFYDMVVQNSDMIEDKEVVVLGIASDERVDTLPNVPTFKEQGYDIVIENWVGLSGPAGIDTQVAEKIRDSAVAIFSLPQVQQKLIDLGITHKDWSSAKYSEFVEKQIAVWAPLIKSSGISEK